MIYRPQRGQRELLKFLEEANAPLRLSIETLATIMNVAEITVQPYIFELKRHAYIQHTVKFDERGENRVDIYRSLNKHVPTEEEAEAYHTEIREDRKQQQHKQYRDMQMAQRRMRKEQARKLRDELKQRKAEATLKKRAERAACIQKQTQANEPKLKQAQQYAKREEQRRQEMEVTLHKQLPHAVKPLLQHPLKPNGKRYKIPPLIPATPPGEPVFWASPQPPLAPKPPAQPPLDPACEPIRPPTRVQLMGGHSRPRRMPLKPW